MPDNSEKKRNLAQKLKDKYRIVVIDDDTLGELKSTKISLLGVFALLTISVLSIMLISYLLLAFTPLKYAIPGYAAINNNKVYMDLSHKIEALEEKIGTQQIYTDGVKNFLNPSGIQVDQLDENQDFIKNNNSKSLKNRKISNQLSLEHYYFCTPLKGDISAGFDLERKHFGIDIVAPKDSAVKNILDGVVILSDWSVKTGNTISIQHRDDMISVYKHNSKLLKKIGQFVKSGEAIAIIGNTGELTSGPHVHFELWKSGIAVDPADYIDFSR